MHASDILEIPVQTKVHMRTQKCGNKEYNKMCIHANTVLFVCCKSFFSGFRFIAMFFVDKYEHSLLLPGAMEA